MLVQIEDTDTNFTVVWTGNYQITGDLFLYHDQDSGNTRTIFGYPTDRITQQISKTLR